MRRLLLAGALLVALGIVVGGAALVLSAGEDDDPPSPPRVSLSVIGTRVTPSVSAFGEPIVAEVVLRADPAVVRANSIRIASDFSPYEPTGPVRVENAETGSSLRVRIRYPLRCLREGCVPNGPRKTFEFPLGSAVYRFRTSPGRASAVLDWPRFEVTGRAGGDAVAAQDWRADVAALPEVSYRWSPTPLAVTLLAGSFALAALGAGLAWRLARRPELAPATELELDAPLLTPLERALELARSACRNGDAPDRRRALERVARELGDQGFDDLETRARALAWAAGSADPAAVDALAHDVRRATNGVSA